MAITTSCSSKNNILNGSNTVGLYNISDSINNIKYDENGFMNNSYEVSKDDSVLFYCINWGATLHRYSPIAHILKVLDLNPNKKIFLYVDNYESTATGYNFDLIKTKYPDNFNYKIVQESYNGDERLSLLFINDLKNDIEVNNLQSSNKRIYFADYQLMELMKLNYKSSNQIGNFFYNTYHYLAKTFKEINLIPDGTATPLTITNRLYSFYKNNNELNFDRNNDKFAKSIELQTNLKHLNNDQFNKWINENENNAMLYIFSLLSSSINDNSDLVKINYYFPFTDMIKDVNSLTSTQLNENIQFDEYFSPFDISGLNIVDFISSLSYDNMNLFRQIINIADVESKFSKDFENHTNLIYSGSLLSNNNGNGFNATIIQDEAKKIINLFETNQNKVEPNTDLQLWFKGHPREISGYQEQLINKVNELAPNKNYGNKIKFLDNNVPFEFLMVSNLFKNEQSKNKYVVIYTTYSTILFTLEASSKSDLIGGLYLSDTQINDIKKTYGDLDTSLCFKGKEIIKI